MTNENVLFVDDDKSILDTYRRILNENFQIETAIHPKVGIDLIKSHGPFAVVVSDLRMPMMDGIEFLEYAQKETPDSVRILLSGNVDVYTAVAAVNEGHIFRLLTKPALLRPCSGRLKTA